MAFLTTEHLSFTYPDADTPALRDVNLNIDAGELVLLSGSIGSGKSTLLRLLKSELAPHGTQAGAVTLATDKIAFVSQTAENTFVSERVRGELAFALENERKSNEEIRLRLGETAAFFNLTQLLDKRLDTLSGGEKACVAIAAAMIADARVLLLDEPLAQLDPKSVQDVLALLRRVNEELGVTVVIASHISEGLVGLCDRMLVLQNGSLIADGTPRTLSRDSRLSAFFPAFTALLEEKPLTVREARACQRQFTETPIQTNDKTNDVAVKCRQISFAYAKGEPDVLSLLDLTVRRGEVHFIIGANGSGKTTLLKLIAGIKKPYAGRVKVSGKCAYLPQNVRWLFTQDRVGDELSGDMLNAFSLTPFADRHPYDLSGGQQQLLAIAKVSAQGFDLLLMDEPSKSLDASGRALLIRQLAALRTQGKTVIIVSHDLELAGQLADTVSFLTDGCMAASGGRREVLSSLTLYTTQVRRITAGMLDSAVTAEDLR